MNKQRVVIFFVMAATPMSTRGGTVKTTEPPAPGEAVQHGLAPVEEVVVVFLESSPLQYI
jgi:hypothetical protein